MKINWKTPNHNKTYLVLSVITGITSALVAVGLKVGSIKLAQIIGSTTTFTALSFALILSLLLLATFLTVHYFPSAAGSGIPTVKASLAINGGRMKFKDTIAKFFTSLVGLSSGLSLGPEGPTVTVAAGIGATLGQKFKLSQDRMKNLLYMGASGGLAAAFNTPIAGVMFCLEEIAEGGSHKSLGPIIVSSFIASITAHSLIGDIPTFTRLSYQLNGHYELLIYLLIGLLSSFGGLLWVKTMLFLRGSARTIFKRNAYLPVVTVVILTAIVSFFCVDALGAGHDSIERVLHSVTSDYSYLALLLFLKFFLSAICTASGISGGLFLPTLVNGALLGGLVGSIFQFFFPEMILTVGQYSLVGMGALFAAVLRTPLTSIFMVFEMTRDYELILPLMIACIVSYAIASKINPGSVNVKLARQDGIFLPDSEISSGEVMEAIRVEDAMVKEVKTFNHDQLVGEIAEKFYQYNFETIPVLKFGKLIGVITKRELRTAAPNDTLEHIAESTVVSIYPDESLLLAFHRMRKFHIDGLPVVSRADRSFLIGIITPEDIVQKFGYHLSSTLDQTS